MRNFILSMLGLVLISTIVISCTTNTSTPTESRYIITCYDGGVAVIVDTATYSEIKTTMQSDNIQWQKESDHLEHNWIGSHRIDEIKVKVYVEQVRESPSKGNEIRANK